MNSVEELKALRDSCRTKNSRFENENVEIGDFTYFASSSPIIRSWKEGAHLRIGKFSSIASGVTKDVFPYEIVWG